MKITCKNCDGEIETLDIKEFKIYQDMFGQFGAKATRLDNNTFLLSDESLSVTEIKDIGIDRAEWKIEKLEILIHWLNAEFRRNVYDPAMIDLITCLECIKDYIKRLSSQ